MMDNYDYDEYDEEYDEYDEAPEAEELDEDAQYELTKKKAKKALIMWSSVLGAVILAGIVFISIVFSILSSRKNRPQDVTSDDTSEYLEYKRGVLDAKNDDDENTLTFTPRSLQAKSIKDDILSDDNVYVKKNHKHNKLDITSKKIFDKDDRVVNNDFDFKQHYNSQDKNYTVRIYFNKTDKDGNVKKFFIQRRFLINYEKILMVFDETNQLVDGFSKEEIKKNTDGKTLDEKIANTIGRDELAPFGFYKSSLRIEKIENIDDKDVQTAYYSKGEEYTKNTEEQNEADINVYRVNFRFNPSDSTLKTTRDNETRNDDGKITLSTSKDNASKFSTWINKEDAQTNIEELGVNNLRDKINSPLFKDGEDLSKYYESQKEWYLLNKNGTTHEDPENNTDDKDRRSRMWDPTNPFEISPEVVKKYGVFTTKTIKINKEETKTIKYYDLYFVATRKLKRMGLHYEYEENGKTVIRDDVLETKDINGTDIDVVIPTLKNKKDEFFAGFKPKESDNPIWDNEDFKNAGNLLQKGAKFKGLRPDRNKPYMEVEPVYKEFRKFDFYFDHPALNKEAMAANEDLAQKFRMRLEDSEVLKDRLENYAELLKELNAFLQDTIYDDASKLNYYLEETGTIDFSKTAGDFFGGDYTKLIRVDMGRRYYTLNVSREVYADKTEKEILEYKDKKLQEEQLGIKRYPYVLGSKPNYSTEVFTAIKNVMTKEYVYYDLSDKTLTSTDPDKGSNFPKEEIPLNGTGVVNATLRLKPIHIKYLDSNNNVLTSKLKNKNADEYYFYKKAITQEALFDNLEFDKPEDNIHELYKDEHKKLFYDRNATIPVSEDEKALEDKHINTNDPNRLVLELFIKSSIKKQTFTFKINIQDPNNLDNYELREEFTYDLDYVKTKQTINFNKYKMINDNIDRILGAEKQYFENKDKKFQYIYNDRDNTDNVIDINFNRKNISVSFRTTHTFFDKSVHNAEARLTLTYGARLTVDQLNEVKNKINPANKVVDNYKADNNDDKLQFFNDIKDKFTFTQALFGAQNIDLPSYDFKTPNAQYNLIFKSPTVDIEVMAAPNGDHDKFHTAEDKNALENKDDNNFVYTKTFIDTTIRPNNLLAPYILETGEDTSTTKYAFKKFTVEQDLIPAGKAKAEPEPVDIATYKDGINPDPIGQIIKNHIKRNPQVDPDPMGRDFRGFFEPKSEEYRILRKVSKVGANAHVIQLRRKVIEIQYITNKSEVWDVVKNDDIKHTYGLYLSEKEIFKAVDPEVDTNKSFYGWQIENFGQTTYNKTEHPKYPVLISDQDASSLVLRFNIHQGAFQATVHTHLVLSQETNNEYHPSILSGLKRQYSDIEYNAFFNNEVVKKYIKEFGVSPEGLRTKVAVENYFKNSTEEIKAALKEKFGDDYILDDSTSLDIATTNEKSTGDYKGKGFLVQKTEGDKQIHLYYFIKRKQYTLQFSKNNVGNKLTEQKFFLGADRSGAAIATYEDDDTFKRANKYVVDGKEYPFSEAEIRKLFSGENKLQGRKNLEIIYKYELKEKYTVRFEGRLLNLTSNPESLSGVSNLPSTTSINREASIGSVLNRFPTKSDYVFMGWYKDKYLSQLVLENEKIVKDITIYAKFIRRSHFGTDQNSDIQIRNVSGGYSIEKINKLSLVGGNYGHFYIPKDIGGTNVVEFGLHPENDTNGSNGTKIEGYKITYIYFASTMNRFRAYSFHNMKDLVQIRMINTISSFYLDTTPNTIAKYTFNNCEKLTNYPYKNTLNIRYVRQYAFNNAQSLPDISLDYIEVAEQNAFYKYNGKITLGVNLTSVGHKAFNYVKFKNLNIIANQLTQLNDDVFSRTNINSFEGKNLRMLGNNAFSNTPLRTFKSSSLIDSEGRYTGRVFENCKELTNVDTYVFNSFYGNGLFYGCSSITKIEIRENLQFFYDYAFAECINLKTINFHGSIRKLQRNADWMGFRNCNFDEFRLPSVTEGELGKHSVFYTNRNQKFTLKKGDYQGVLHFIYHNFGSEDPKYTRDNPFIFNYEGPTTDFFLDHQFFSFAEMLVYNSYPSSSQKFRGKGYKGSSNLNYIYNGSGRSRYITSDDNKVVYNMFAGWDGTFPSNPSILYTGKVATKLTADDIFTMPSSLRELEYDRYDAYGAPQWLDLNRIDLNYVNSVKDSYFTGREYYINGNIIHLQEEDGRFINKQTNKVVGLSNFSRFRRKDLMLNDSLYVPLNNTINRRNVYITNYTQTLQYLDVNTFLFQNPDSFIQKNNNVVSFNSDGTPSKSGNYMGEGRAYKINFSSDFAKLRSYNIYFSTYIASDSNELDLTYFTDFRVSGKNIKYPQRIRYIEGSLQSLTGSLTLKSDSRITTGDIYSNSLNYLKIDAPEFYADYHNSGQASIIHLKTKLLSKTENNFFHNDNTKIIISELTTGSVVKKISNKIKVFDISKNISWTSLGVKSEDYYRVDSLYEENGMKFALLDKAYPSSSMKQAVLYALGDNYSKDLVIPEKINYNGKTYAVAEVIDKLFYNNQKINSVVFPKTIINLGKEIFYSSGYLRKVEFKCNVKVVDKNLFYSCGNLRELVFAYAPEVINLAKSGCYYINTIQMPNNIFYGLLSNTLIDKRTKSVEYGLRSANSNINIPFGVIGVASFAFYNRTITKLSLPATIKILEDQAFYAAYLPAKIEFHEGLEELKYNSLYLYGGPYEIILPRSVKKIANDTFSSNCKVKFRGDRPLDFDETKQNGATFEYNYEG